MKLRAGTVALVTGLAAAGLIVRRATFDAQFVAVHPGWIYIDAGLAAGAGLMFFFASTASSSLRSRVALSLLAMTLAVAATVIAAQDSLVGQTANPLS